MLSIFSWIWSFGHLRYVLVITILKNQKKKTKIRITEESVKRNELRS